ncbi:hypothetical protein EDB84DRAFT_1444291 [Lactarius hengduanensis]|nr:hypothetical protein EDB84DRAFT_1444291 [Lactarius hengduanensis]
MAFLSCLSAPVSVRRHLKLTLSGNRQNHPLWERFSSLMCETIAAVPDPPHGAHFRHELHGNQSAHLGYTIRTGTPPISVATPGLIYYSLEIRYPGPGATELLASASKAITTGPSFDEEGPHGDVLPSGLQRVIIDRGEFCTRVLWKWIHYAFKFVPPATADYSDLRKDVLALLSKRSRGSVKIKPMEDSTKALLVFSLCCGSRNDSVFKFALVECKWDEPDGLEILRLLLHSLDLDRDAILETTRTSSD